MSHVHSHDHGRPLEGALALLGEHLSARGASLGAVPGAPDRFEAHVLRGGQPTGVTVTVSDGAVRVSRHEFEGSLVSGVQLGAARPLADLAPILADLDDRLAGRPLAGRADPLFPVTASILARLRGAGLAAALGGPPDWDVPYEIDRVVVRDADGEPGGVEVVVAENASWVRVDGEDGLPVDHDQMADTVEAALTARDAAPGMGA